MKIQPVRGTHDLYGYQLSRFRTIEDIVHNQANIYDFTEIRTPIFESSNLFKSNMFLLSDFESFGLK